MHCPQIEYSDSDEIKIETKKAEFRANLRKKKL